MRTVVAVASVAVAASLAGCFSHDKMTGPGPAGPRFDVELNCDMDESKCDQVRAGIEYLLNHANPACRNAGITALGRFEAPASTGDGYREHGQIPDADMFVQMTTGASYSGHVPTSGHVEVLPSFFANPNAQKDGALIAHEEYHQYGLDGANHNTGMAASIQTACTNNQS